MTEIKKEGSVLLKFGMKNCPPCKQLQPILDELKEENQDVEFIEVDAQEERELSAEYGIRSVPTLIYIRDGAVQNQTVGFKNKEEIQENLNLLAE